MLGDLAIDRVILRVPEQGQHGVACRVGRRLVARQQEPLPAVARCAINWTLARSQCMRAWIVSTRQSIAMSETNRSQMSPRDWPSHGNEIVDPVAE